MVNKLKHNVIAYIRRIVNKFCVLIGITLYFENNYGVKTYNKVKFVLSPNMPCVTIIINPQDVFLSYDALKDDYTYVDSPLTISPHVDMIRKVYNHEDVSDSRYVKAELNGCLDGRFEQVDNSSLRAKHINCTLNPISKTAPIVYELNGRYYVLDGKHRLSSAFLKKEKEVTCLKVPLSIVAEYVYTQGVYKNMKMNSHLYKKNIEHIEQMISFSQYQ